MMDSEKELVPLMAVYYRNGQYVADYGKEIPDMWAFYGFLKILIKDHEYRLLDELKPKGDDKE